jgi:hypothetical protein
MMQVHDDLQQGGFPAAILTHQADPVFLVDDKAGISEQWGTAELDCDILD